MLDGPENVITLCGACHQNFDHIDDPGWIFHPTDIKYFIQFECHDRERRASERAAGLEPKRTVPNGETYLKHQRTQGLVPKDSIGGLYCPVILKTFLHETLETLLPSIHQGLMEHLTRARPWHGAPIAAFRRALASGSLRAAVFSDETFKDLRLLYELYFRFPEDYNPSNTIPPAPSNDRPHDQRPASGHDEHPDEEGKPSGSGSQQKRRAGTTLKGRSKSKKGKDKDNSVVSQKDETTTFNTPIQPGGAEDQPVKRPAASMGQCASCAFGPNSTSASIMRKYGPMLVSRPQEESWWL
jgi:hypothetical protein